MASTPPSSPYVIANCAMSLDGFIDDASPERLILSNAEDWERVDELRASCDAILVGANTVRRDNPSLLIRHAKYQDAQPIKITVTRSGQLDPDLNFFRAGTGAKYVLCPSEIEKDLKARLSNSARVFGINEGFTPHSILKKLSQEGVNKLLLEGGTEILTSFLEADLINELQVAVAPFFVANEKGARLVSSGSLRYSKNSRMVLTAVKQVGDMALLMYRLQTQE